MCICRICENEKDNKEYVAREMQFGLRTEFEYFECAQCGCLQIKEIPEDLSQYYPPDYPSFRPAECKPQYTKRGLRGYKERFVRDQITKYYLNRNVRFGGWLARHSVIAGRLPFLMDWMRLQKLNLGLTLQSAILDVGCGNGHLLHELAAHGFSNLTGVDPFIERDIFCEDGVKILKRNLKALEDRFDFIMLHDSFEHMTEPLATLEELFVLLKPGQYILIKLPVAGSYAWKKYGVNWLGLDAPRHLYLHTTKSMNILAERAGLRVADVVYDAMGFGLWGSEQYLRDVPLIDSRSAYVNPLHPLFTAEEMRSFKKFDEELNKSGEADSACFYLYKDEVAR